MYATITRYQGSISRDEQFVQAVRQLAAGLSRALCFVSFVILETGSDTVASVNIYEDKDSLVEADRLVGELLADRLPARPSEHPQVTSGEIVFQRGL